MEKTDQKSDEKTIYEGDSAIDFKQEKEKLSEGSQWFNPEPGTHIVKFLSNGRVEDREYEGEKRKVGIFEVEVDGEELNWSVTKAKSKSSLWGQIMKIGAAREGLKGEEVTLIRNGTGKETNYTIQEAADL